MFGTLGATELLIIAGIALLIFGPKRLPQMGRALGETIKEFKGVGKQIADIHDDVKDQRVDL